MSKFKIGDRVKDVTGHYKYYQLEESPIGTLKAHNGYTWTVDWDTDIGPDCWADDQLELANPSPVRSKTIYEIVTGVYGRISVSQQGGDEPRLLIALADLGGNVNMVHQGWSLDELSEVITNLTAIRDAFREQDK